MRSRYQHVPLARLTVNGITLEPRASGASPSIMWDRRVDATATTIMIVVCVPRLRSQGDLPGDRWHYVTVHPSWLGLRVEQSHGASGFASISRRGDYCVLLVRKEGLGTTGICGSEQRHRRD